MSYKNARCPIQIQASFQIVTLLYFEIIKPDKRKLGNLENKKGRVFPACKRYRVHDFI